MTKNTRFSPQVRQRAVRIVTENQSDYDSPWSTISSIAPEIGCTPETLCTRSRLNATESIKLMTEFKSFRRTKTTLAGIAIIHLLCKGQLQHPHGDGLFPAEQFYLLVA